MDTKDTIKQIIKAVLPLLWYLAVGGIISMLRLPAAVDASARVALIGIICIPLLLWWYRQDRKNETGDEETGDGPLSPFPETFDCQQTILERRQRTVPCLLGRVLRAAACFLAGAALSCLSAYIMEKTGMYERFSNITQESYQASAPVWLILGPGLLAPLCEELAYRGLFFRRIMKLIPFYAAAILTSLLFAAGHGNIIQFLYALPMSLLLCAVGRDNLINPLMMHLGANLYAVVAALLL